MIKDVYMRVVEAIYADDFFEIMQIYVKKPSCINRTDGLGMYPIHWACFYGRVTIVMYLAENGGHIDDQNIDGLTPLQLASDRGHFEVVRFLIDIGADKTIRSNDGLTASELAEIKGYKDIVKYIENNERSVCDCFCIK